MLKNILIFILSLGFCMFAEPALLPAELNDEAKIPIGIVIQDYIKSVSENLEMDVAIILTRNKYHPDGSLQQVDTLGFSSTQENNNFNISLISPKAIEKLQKDAEDKGVLLSLEQQNFQEDAETHTFHTTEKEIPDSVAASVAAAGKDGFEVGLVEEVANIMDMTVTSGTIQLLEHYASGKIKRNRTSTLYPQKVVIVGVEKMSARMQQSAEALMKKAYKIDVGSRAHIIEDLFAKKFPKYKWQVFGNATHYWIDDIDTLLVVKVGSDTYDIVGNVI